MLDFFNNSGILHDGSSLLLRPNHHEILPLPRVLLLLYDCDPFIAASPPAAPLFCLSQNALVSSHIIGAFLNPSSSPRFCFIGWVLPLPVANSVSKKHLCVAKTKKRNPFKELVHDFIVALQGYIL